MPWTGDVPSQSPSIDVSYVPTASYSNQPTYYDGSDSFISAKHSQKEDHFHSIIAPVLALLALIIIIVLCQYDFSGFIPRKPRYYF